MRTTRSATRSAAAAGAAPDTSITDAAAPPVGKRKLEAEIPQEATKRKRASKPTVSKQLEAAPPSNSDAEAQATPTTSSSSGNGEDVLLVPAKLTFSFEEAKNHLINVDHRFEDLFDKMTCRPFQHLETVHPFRALVTSILGQQISWLAARSIVHKFRRLYDSSLPEKPTDHDHKSPISSFPSPEQVAKTDFATLRSAGLSTRKVEYVQDLASRFADGRLSTKKLIEADDDELARMLIEVRGIGRWTVDMFAIFSLRRPDILPVGDLGVQRGLARWFLSLHSPAHGYSISPEKVGGTANPKPNSKAKKGKVKGASEDEDENSNSPTPDISSVPPTTVLEEEDPSDEIPTMPPPFTPSIRKTLNKAGASFEADLVPLPDGLGVDVLKSRLNGKKKMKGALLSPKEMEDLTEGWKPYRSIGVYYMWSLADV